MAFQLDRLESLEENDIAQFADDGFLIVENVLNKEQVERVRASIPCVFSGEFDTGIYPDEWHWREGLSLPDVTRQICNGWKSDLGIANLALSKSIGIAATRLSGWKGVKLGQDTVWWKPPQTKAVTLHQDASFLDYLNPGKMITCWVALDDTKREAGTLEYVPGSHSWPLTAKPAGFHAPDDYRAPMKHAAKSVGIEPPDSVMIEVQAGSCVFHNGEIWHGSGPNTSGNLMRRSIGIHMVPSDAVFTEGGGGYIYRRYQRTGDPQLDESFFPVLWDNNGHRTGWIKQFCETGLRR